MASDTIKSTVLIGGLLLAAIAVNMIAVVKKARAERCIGSVYSTTSTDQNGTTTASGIPLNDAVATIAHNTLPLRSHARVTNLKTGRSARLLVTDRGPHVAGRCVDFSVAAARLVGCNGLCPVTVR